MSSVTGQFAKLNIYNYLYWQLCFGLPHFSDITFILYLPNNFYLTSDLRFFFTYLKKLQLFYYVFKNIFMDKYFSFSGTFILIQVQQHLMGELMQKFVNFIQFGIYVSFNSYPISLKYLSYLQYTIFFLRYFVFFLICFWRLRFLLYIYDYKTSNKKKF